MNSSGRIYVIEVGFSVRHSDVAIDIIIYIAYTAAE